MPPIDLQSSGSQSPLLHFPYLSPYLCPFLRCLAAAAAALVVELRFFGQEAPHLKLFQIHQKMLLALGWI